MLDQVIVLGLDWCRKPRGARFTVLRDSTVSAAMDMNCRVLIGQPRAVCAPAKRLPIGRVLGTGVVVSLVLPNISRKLYDGILETTRIAAAQDKARMEEQISRTIH
jgi:hypothetical protein